MINNYFIEENSTIYMVGYLLRRGKKRKKKEEGEEEEFIGKSSASIVGSITIQEDDVEVIKGYLPHGPHQH
eukprot:11605137-Prorocentrum_lima.AAC.1